MRIIATNPELARPTIQKIVKSYSKNTPKLYTGLVGENIDHKLAFYRMEELSDMPEASAISEGTDIPVANMTSVNARDFYVGYIAQGYEISAQAEYTDFHNAIKKPTEQLIQSMDDAKEQRAANAALNNAFLAPASGGTWTLDNVALYSASHPLSGGATYSNTASLALGAANLAVAWQSAKFSKTYNQKVWRGPTRFKLLVPAQLEDLAIRLTTSEQLPQSADNDVNVAKRLVTPMVNPYFTDTNNWSVIPAEDRFNPLFMMTRMPRRFVESKLERRPGDMFYGYAEEYGFGAMNWRGTYGCNP